jgi:hypothetical protein
MARAESEDGNIKVIPSHAEAGGFKRFVVTLLILLVISWVTLFFVVRSDGGRVLIENHLETRFGMDMSIESAALGFPFALILKNIQSQDVETTRAGFRADKIRLSMGVHPRWKITMVHPELNLVYERGVGWLPARFSDIGDLPREDIRQLSRLSRELRKRVVLGIQDGNIDWRNEAGEEMATAKGIRFELAPAEVPEHEFFFYSLVVEMGVGPDAGMVKEVESQWLSSEKHDYIEISRSESLPPESDSGFWGTQP